MGLLDLPAKGSNRTNLCDQYRHSKTRIRQQQKYHKLVARHEPAYIDSTHELEMPATKDAASREHDSIDPLTAAVKQLTVTEEKDKATIRTANIRQSMEHAARHRRRTCIVDNNQQSVSTIFLAGHFVNDIQMKQLQPEHA
jgi:hypothetical protein